MTGETQRCFLGIPLPQAVREPLVGLCDTWRDAGLTGAWVRPANLHITVRFFGDLTGPQREALDQALTAELHDVRGMRLRLSGAGCFPGSARPRILWAGVSLLGGDLDALFNGAEAAARAIGLPAERKAVHPHVTLLRMRTPAQRTLAAECVARAGDFTSDAFAVDAVALWKSTLHPGGAHYEELKEYAFP